jgi:formylglycine-generating enzyme required for sulfatase activity
MASNLTITANFKDVTKPTNAITFPAANQTWSNSVITVTGKASDNVGVAAVWYQINNGGWAAAGTTNSFTNWSIPNLVVIAGTNLLQAYAEDAAGNVSVTNAVKFRCILPPAGMVLIPAGWFNMGDALDGESDAVPVRSVYVSAFYMDTNLVSYSQWQSVYNWATSQGYGFVNAGAGKATNHPVQTVDWYDVVKWCNARSQQAGLVPVYYTDTNFTKVYTNGETDAIYVNWTNSGYRLPTEAEWEKAARGGLSGQRFPWGNFISETNANYCLGPNDYNPIGSIGGTSPATSPVGSFAANGYGLYEMAGNVYEWCWDWKAPYSGTNNPQGPGSQPSSDPTRVERGGGWDGYAYTCRTANRSDGGPAEGEDDIGFRSVMSFSSNSVPPVITFPTVPFTFTTNNGTITITGYTGTNPVVTIPSMINGWPVTTIGDYAFYTNSIMANVTIPNSVTSIGDSAFQYCSLTNVTIPNGVTSIGEAAFYSCRSLPSVAIPASVTSIGIEAFGQCTSLTTITVDAQNLLYSSVNGVLFNKSQTMLVEYPAGVGGNYTIPNSVTSIGDSAFYSGSLTSVTIPNSVTNIGELAFVGGPLTTITVDTQNLLYSSVNGVLFNKGQTTLVEFPGGWVRNYTIPNSTTSIGETAFYAQYGLTNVTIPNSVTSIGIEAFYNCIGLTNITIPTSVANIGDYAFAYCYDLTGAYFLGDAPSLDSTVFLADPVTIYYLPGTTGWSAFSTATGVPIVPWFLPNPVVLNNEPSFGVQTNQFGFNISWATNASVVVQACTNLANPVWLPVVTNTLTNGTFYFSDANWTNYHNRFYRLNP